MDFLTIVSGGQTGVDRAALDAAIHCGLPVDGWCPRGRLAEDGRIPVTYTLKETPGEDVRERTAWNVRDSDATLLVFSGRPSGGTLYTRFCAEHQGKRWMELNLAPAGGENISREDIWRIVSGVLEGEVRRLNIAGPRESERGLYEKTRVVLTQMLNGIIEEKGKARVASREVGR